MSDEIKKEEPEQEVSARLLKEAISSADVDQVAEIVDGLSSQEALRQVSLMNAEERDQFTTMLAPEALAELVEEAPAGLAVTLIDDLETTVAAQVMEELSTDTQADIVQELTEEKAENILEAMKPEEAGDVRTLTQYSPDTAGGLMELDVFSFFSDATVGDVLRRFVAEDDEFERYRGQHPYIVDETGRLLGVVSLRNLLRGKRAVLLTEIMTSPKSVTVDTHQDELISLFDDNPFLGIPVVGENNLLLGVVSREAVAEAALERAEHESMSRQQVGDELRSMPTLLRSRRRLAWLSSNIVLNIIAASVIASYEQTLAAVIAIAIFLPMVSDMSGCSGNQAVAVSMRELALGLTRPSDLFHVLKKEFSVGVINGIILGILIGIVVWLWKGNIYLGVVIGLALSVNTILSVSIGGTVPLLLKRFGIDPAVASGPLLTTVTDMAGFFLVLSLATLFMPVLTG